MNRKWPFTMTYERHAIRKEDSACVKIDVVAIGVLSEAEGHAFIAEWNKRKAIVSTTNPSLFWKYKFIAITPNQIYTPLPDNTVIVSNDFHRAPKQMPDITERLRAGAGGMKHWQELHTEAANEIDRLRQAIKSEAQYCFHWRDESIKKGDTDRAKRHEERGLRLMAHIEPHKTK